MRLPIILRAAMEVAVRMSWRLAAVLALLRDALTKLGVAPIGVTPADTGTTNLCPAGDIMLRHGDLIHYVSDKTYPGFDIAGNPVIARSA